MSSRKEGEDAYIRIGEALDRLDKRHLISDSGVQIRSPEQVNGTLSHHNQFVTSTAELYNKNETQIPSELITSCVATMFMIQVT